jgi:hypothetical protein
VQSDACPADGSAFGNLCEWVRQSARAHEGNGWGNHPERYREMGLEYPKGD